MKKSLLFILLAYCGMVSYLYVNQRNLIFIPKPFDESVKYIFSDVYLDSKDGAKIHAWWVKSDNPIGVSLVYCHGNAAVLSSLIHVAEIFKGYGFDTILLDYRGYGRSTGGTLSESGAVSDVVAAYNWVTKEKNQPVILWGHSLGSSICANAAKNLDIKGLILEGAFTSIFDMARKNYPYVPIIEALFLDRFDTESYINRTPKLFIHADNDSVVPKELGEKLFAGAPEPKKWIEIPKIDHNDFPDVADQYKEEILFWVKDVLRES